MEKKEQLYEGKAKILIGGVACTLAEGDTLLMPANVPHAVNPQGQFKMLLVMIKEIKA